MDQQRFMSGELNSSDEIEQDVGFRPKSFAEYIGQKKVVQNIELMIESARIRGQAMDHVLLSGPPGLGKTTLAYLMAQELGVQLHVVSGPAIDKKGDLAATLTNLSPRDVLFIDEIHRLPIVVEEILYSAMEDFRLDILIGQGASARTMQIQIPPFTLVGATTRSGLLSSPLRDRFLAHCHFDYYEVEDLQQIVERNTVKMRLPYSASSLLLLAKRSRGTPRLANRILRRVRDFILVSGAKELGEFEVLKALDLMEIDELGLDAVDRKILQVMANYYKGGPVGIEALSATLSEDKQTIEDVYEPFLLKQGLIIRTPRGRVLSDKGSSHIKESV